MAALSLHLAVVLLAFTATTLWNRHTMPPVYTVRLIDVPQAPHPRPAPAVKKAPSPPAPPVQKPAPKPPAPPKEAPKAPPPPPKPEAKPVEPSPPAPAKPKKVVSLNPKKAEPVKKEAPKPAEAPKKEPPKPKAKAPDADAILKARLKNIQHQVQEKEAQAHLNERLAALSAQIEAKEDAKAEATKTGPSEAASAPASGPAEDSPAMNLYYNEVWARVRSHWVLPEQLVSRAGIEAIVVVRIEADGTISKAWFEKKSDDPLFDQSAQRAVDASNPLPPIPKALGSGPMELGLRFRPEDMN